ncbi:hypothetical protein L1049_009859 [Liquidambar formosana]|uniref:pyruvate decarboxylase n=1 Tax=Liquidambar formosana TaxID=63359 RepID=A0AAP0R4D7_LIQFO
MKSALRPHLAPHPRRSPPAPTAARWAGTLLGGSWRSAPRTFSAIPGDFNLTLLDHLIAEPELNYVGCCNELNAGYAADGYAGAKGAGACVVTFTVGGLSVINAIAGSYSENLPVIRIVGGPNSNDYWMNRILHHTIGLPDFSQELRCFQTVTCGQAVVNNLEDAYELIDTAISTALKESKPAYISICCNLPGIPHPTFATDPVPFCLESNRCALLCILEEKQSGDRNISEIRVAKAQQAFVELADACGYPIAIMPSAKGLVPEHHPHFIGTYWGAVSTAFCAEIGMLSGETTVSAETGDSWFNCQNLRLPENCGYEFQMQYGSIGWSVGATLGYAQAAKDRHLIASIGDGSFQVTAQDVSTMIRYGQRSIIFLINNGGYTIEVEIHDGPYNVIKNWDYTGLVDAIHNGEGKCWTKKVRTEKELIEAIAVVRGAHKYSLCFIKVIVHKDDTSKELLEWGSRVSAANSCPPNPQ